MPNWHKMTNSEHFAQVPYCTPHACMSSKELSYNTCMIMQNKQRGLWAQNSPQTNAHAHPIRSFCINHSMSQCLAFSLLGWPSLVVARQACSESDRDADVPFSIQNTQEFVELVGVLKCPLVLGQKTQKSTFYRINNADLNLAAATCDTEPGSNWIYWRWKTDQRWQWAVKMS